jgi:DNA-binding transcriptional MerR regulator
MASDGREGRRGDKTLDKAPDAFRTISEVADEINVPQHVLRFWESRFTQIRPLKRGGGRRYYRPDDIDLLRGVRHLLYGEGYTIRGVQRILREQGLSFVQSVWRDGAEPLPPESEEDEAADEMEETEQVAAASGEEPALLDFALGAAADEHPNARREPTIIPAPLVPAPQRHGVSAADRRNLQTALDELAACRSLLDAAFADHSSSED